MILGILQRGLPKSVGSSRYRLPNETKRDEDSRASTTETAR